MCKKKQFKYCPSEIDICLRLWIKGLNQNGIKTLASCCGHKKYPRTIVIESNNRIEELYSGKVIPRTKRFYKKDKQGYYFLPEISSQNDSKQRFQIN